ncbi:GNAT family N-acetyltransferase [Shewanella waksmanii]|uniref:GNAT family N-acetyltransferase n=1 Tax=Shewanella waksmanii TaxID=213783 RepID=UPI00373552E9
MRKSIQFRHFHCQDKPACLQIFDLNCPTYFAPNERNDFNAFFDSHVSTNQGYEVCLVNNHIVGACGLLGDSLKVKSINWILIAPEQQGLGIGAPMMEGALMLSKQQQLSHINIAASHLSAPFFAKYGAQVVSETTDGWGAGMHRVDMVLACQ